MSRVSAAGRSAGDSVPDAGERAARATGRGFDWQQPYPSRRSPILARNVVATSQPLATQAGIAVLQAGGNAIDAVLATAIALTVVRPCSNGLGSDLFALVWDGRELAGLNASGRAPGRVDAAALCGPRGDAARRLGHRDDPWRRVGLGGAVAARRRSLRRLFASDPYARDGYAVSRSS
jgi:gamma-glutamyltranspeptidase